MVSKSLKVKHRPPADRGSVVYKLLHELPKGPRTREQLRAVGINDAGLRRALMRMRRKGWILEGIMLTPAGLRAATELAGWVHDNPAPPERKEPPPDHLVEQVRHWKGVRW